jgi:hypothetical protein
VETRLRSPLHTRRPRLPEPALLLVVLACGVSCQHLASLVRLHLAALGVQLRLQPSALLLRALLLRKLHLLRRGGVLGAPRCENRRLGRARGRRLRRSSSMLASARGCGFCSSP